MTDKNEFHYFASHAMGWVTAETEAAAIEKLLLNNTDPSWARNCLKDGEPLVLFVCRVPLAADAPYRIEWFCPKVEGLTETKNMLVTYLTKTKYAVMRDPRDTVTKLKRKLEDTQQALFNLSYACATSESIHDDHIVKFTQESRELIPYLFEEKAAETIAKYCTKEVAA